MPSRTDVTAAEPIYAQKAEAQQRVGRLLHLVTVCAQRGAAQHTPCAGGRGTALGATPRAPRWRRAICLPLTHRRRQPRRTCHEMDSNVQPSYTSLSGSGRLSVGRVGRVGVSKPLASRKYVRREVAHVPQPFTLAAPPQPLPAQRKVDGAREHEADNLSAEGIFR